MLKASGFLLTSPELETFDMDDAAPGNDSVAEDDDFNSEEEEESLADTATSPEGYQGMEIEEHLCESFPQLDVEELYATMRTKEQEAEQTRYAKSFVEYRSVIVEWMTQVGETLLGLTPLTIHLAVAYLDKAVSKQEVHPSRLQLFAVAAILAAAKHEEKETKVPSVSDLNYYCCKNIYTPQIICKTEVLLLNKLNWELMLLTPRHFLEFFLGRGASSIYPETDILNGSAIAFDKHFLVQRYLRKYSEFFIDLCLQDYNFSSYLPSIVASSAIATARRQLQLIPPWPKHLKKVTGYKLAELSPCVDHIWSVYQRHFADV